MPTFDPSELLEMSFGDDFNTRATPFPEGECYARVKSITGKEVTTKTGDAAIVVETIFVTDDDVIKQATKMNEPSVRYSIFLELVPGTKRVMTKDDNPNANLKLGRLKMALGVKAGKKFRLNDLVGLACYIKTKQRLDPEDSETIYTDVVGVSAEPFSRRRADAA